MKTLYDVLGVNRFCTKDELDQAYNTLLKEQMALLDSNPPETQASEIRFEIDAIRHAYSVLSDPVKRLEYNNRITNIKIKDSRESFGFAGALSDVLPKSIPFLLIFILAVVPSAYIISHHQLKKVEITSEERLSSKALDSASVSIDHQVALEEEKLAMERERLQHEIELLKMEQERLKQQQENEMKKT